MSLQRKTAVVVGLLLATLVAGLYLAVARSIERGATAAELQRLELNIERLRRALESDARHLAAEISDWAVWDDSYNFLANPTDEFVERNLSGTTIADLGLSFVAFLDPEGGVVWCGAPSPDRRLTTAVPEDVRELLAAEGRWLVSAPPNECRRGLVRVGNAAFLVAGQRVVRSSALGGDRGGVVFGTRVDRAYLENLSNLLVMHVHLEPADESVPLPPLLVESPSDQIVRGTSVLKDIHGRPAFRYGATYRCLIVPEARNIISRIRVVLVLAAAGAIAATLLALRFIVLRRMIDLSDQVKALGAEGGLGRRVRVEGKDEIAGLGAAFNAALDALETSQARVAENEALLRALTDGVPALVWLIDAEGRTVFRNAAWNALHGSRDPTAGSGSWIDAVHPDDVDACRGIFHRALAAAAPFQVEARLLNAAGAERWMLIKGEPRADRNGVFAGYVACGIDVTDRREAEHERDQSFAVSLDLMCVATLEGYFTRVNPSFTRVLGHPEAVLLGRPFLELVHPEDRERTIEQLSRLAVGLPVVDFENRYVCADGTYRWLSWSAPALELGATRIYAVARDVTEKKAMEQALRQAKEQAEEANRAKDRFLSHMSHEIRTPLTAILGFAELLADGAATAEELLRHARTIRSNAEHLLGIVNDVLDFSKIEAGRMQTERVACDPGAIVRELAVVFEPQARRKGIALEIEVDPSLPRGTLTDPTRLRQILLNLVGNAVKFTDSGRVRVRAGFRDGWLEFAVSDTGVGMNAEQLSRIFTPFTQADASTTRRFGGTGLGLSISAKLAELLGGSIRAESAPGRGSCFTLVVPHRAAAVLDAEATSTTAHAGSLSGRVLVVEDSPDIQRLLVHHLRAAGLEVETADTGRHAIDRVEDARREKKPFDLILIDMQMPEMDGLEATRRLRQARFAGPVIALSARATTEDCCAAIEAGCDDFASKPIARQRLIELVRDWLSRSGARRAA